MGSRFAGKVGLRRGGNFLVGLFSCLGRWLQRLGVNLAEDRASLRKLAYTMEFHVSFIRRCVSVGKDGAEKLYKTLPICWGRFTMKGGEGET